ncbi:phage tail protein [Pseudomonas protegens]|uniref:phage tail protein n=1 Tax=Pseudomonas protegens TaxID=380021 RepID=UPI0018839BCC|nr:phage tail protein [Pseudomonas protegens]MBF0639787.1 phage tail protein [Pseudomonas protegens]
MNKLRALTKFLIDRRLVMPEQIDSWAEAFNLDLIWKPTTKGLHMGDMRYRAVLVIERFAANPALLMALVGSWLETQDPDRDDDLPAPLFNIEQLDNDGADVELTLEFIEPQHLAEDPDGLVEAFGKTWGLVDFDLWTAEQGEVRSHGA